MSNENNHLEEQELYVRNPELWLQQETESTEYMCLVIFRGAWCKFDEHYLKLLGEYHRDNMPDVKLIAWTSEGADAARKADEAWGLSKKFGYAAVIGDESIRLAKYLKDEELLPKLVITPKTDAHLPKDVFISGEYPNGIVQPAMLFYAHHGVEVLNWVAKVNRPYYGASSRPAPSEVWRKVQKRKESLDHGNAVLPAQGSKLKQCTTAFDVYGSRLPWVSKVIHRRTL